MKTLLSYTYGAIVALRNRAYDRGFFGVARAAVPVLSVGNVTAGGTGKTPVVEYLAARLLGEGRRVAVVTRGYRRATRGNFLVSDGRGSISSAHDGGDEPVQVARKFPSLIVIADERRSRGCARAVEEFGVDVILLDDAFQHRSMFRDLDVVVIDAGEPLAAQRLLPAGRLREPLANLRRADVIVLGRCESAKAAIPLRGELAAYTAAPVFATRFAARTLRRLGDDRDLPLDALSGVPLGAFCGIGRPSAFHRTLDSLGMNVMTRRDFPDHHWFGATDIARLNDDARAAGARAWVTTEKDATRLLDGLAWQALGEVYYPRMEVEFLGEMEAFDAIVAERCAPVR